MSDEHSDKAVAQCLQRSKNKCTNVGGRAVCSRDAMQFRFKSAHMDYLNDQLVTESMAVKQDEIDPRAFSHTGTSTQVSKKNRANQALIREFVFKT